MTGDIARCKVCGAQASYVVAYQLDQIRTDPFSVCSRHSKDLWVQLMPLKNHNVVYFDQRATGVLAHAIAANTGDILHVG